MNEYIKKARLFIEKEKLDYLLVNSTNEFLVEYNELERNSRYFLTGFSGSTGDALVTKDKVFLFPILFYFFQLVLKLFGVVAVHRLYQDVPRIFSAVNKHFFIVNYSFFHIFHRKNFIFNEIIIQ